MTPTCSCHRDDGLAFVREEHGNLRPSALVDVPKTCQVELDVREDIRRGEMPLAKIMATAKALGNDAVLVLRAPFEPVPLYNVLAKRSFAHWTEHCGQDDWRVFFYRATADTKPSKTEHEIRDCRAVLDVRGLEPPEPMVRVLEELDRLGPGRRAGGAS